MKPPHEMFADKMGGDDEPDDDDATPEGDYDEGLKAAAESIIDAVHSKDVDGLVAALKSAHELCEKACATDDGDKPDTGGHAAMLLIPHGKA